MSRRADHNPNTLRVDAGPVGGTPRSAAPLERSASGGVIGLLLTWLIDYASGAMHHEIDSHHNVRSWSRNKEMDEVSIALTSIPASGSNDSSACSLPDSDWARQRSLSFIEFLCPGMIPL